MSIAKGKTTLRLLRFLDENGRCKSTPVSGTKENHLLILAQNGRRLLVNRQIFEMLAHVGLLRSKDASVQLTMAGTKRIKRVMTASADDPGGFAGQHRVAEQREIRIDGDIHKITVNTNESPLARLRKRQDGHGRPWIDDIAYEAGERLRRDFTIGGLMQRVTANWDAALGNAGRKSGAGAMTDLTDSAIDARQRLDDALEVVGPDLGGVLTDFCCFLKGLENIERERRWPPRSAKLMLRTGLILLARFYGMEARGPARSRLHGWDGEGYRPEIVR